MVPLQTSWNLDWLTTTPASNLQFDRGWADIPPRPIPLPPEWGTGTMELYHLGQGMDIARIKADFTPGLGVTLLPFAAIRGSLPEPMFGIHMVHHGRCLVQENCIGKDFDVQSGDTFFQHVECLDYVPSVENRGSFDARVITMGTPVLTKLLGREDGEAVLGLLGLGTPNRGKVTKLPSSIGLILQQTLPRSLSGPMQLLFSQAKTLEFLCALAGSIKDYQGAFQGKNRLSAIVAELRGELMSLEGKVPYLNDLADKYGVPAKVLNDEFRKLYGVTIYAFISDYRLGEAHGALRRTETPMKAIAANLGYSHVNHFISAFKRKYGYPPGSIRKGLVE